jgi:hypothetical protein
VISGGLTLRITSGATTSNDYIPGVGASLARCIERLDIATLFYFFLPVLLTIGKAIPKMMARRFV